jgi:hypothetical protein
MMHLLTVDEIFHLKYLVFHINITVDMSLTHFSNKATPGHPEPLKTKEKFHGLAHLSLYQKVSEDSPVCYQTCSCPLSYMATVTGCST